MKIVIKMLSTAEMRRRHKVAENRPVQAAIDSECMRYMSDYMPRRQWPVRADAWQEPARCSQSKSRRRQSTNMRRRQNTRFPARQNM